MEDKSQLLEDYEIILGVLNGIVDDIETEDLKKAIKDLIYDYEVEKESIEKELGKENREELKELNRSYEGSVL